jgi:hypothetical protein
MAVSWNPAGVGLVPSHVDATEPKPIDPELLAELRSDAANGLVECSTSSDDVLALLADHAWQERRGDSLDRLRIDAEAMVLALETDIAILKRRAEQTERERDEARAEVSRLRARVRVEAEDVERAGVTWADIDAWLLRDYPDIDLCCVHLTWGDDIAGFIRNIYPRGGRSDWDILDEMAAMRTETER